jgi:hypothetical protein
MDSQSLISDFLMQKRIAVVGVSRKGKAPANFIYSKFKKEGYIVFAINPNVIEIEGEKVYHDIMSIPGGIDAVIIATHPEITEDIMEQCAGMGVKYVWIHRSFGKGSYNEKAAKYAKLQHINLIENGCPLMYLSPDVVHSCMKWILKNTGRNPEKAVIHA